MLARWLDASLHEAFLVSRKERRAFARASVASVKESLFDWSKLSQVLADSHAADVLVTRDGALAQAPTPRDEAAVRALLVDGCGLVVRHAQGHCVVLEALARELEIALPGAVQVQLFVTPAGSRGFAWHYDREEVFILQTVGTKTYFMRENTVVTDLADPIDFERFRSETSPLQACTLRAGDLLYLPRGMWHMGRAESTAFSISLGLTPTLA
ncbi:MAG: cupin domain-containing protein [Polyangiales bacterium]